MGCGPIHALVASRACACRKVLRYGVLVAGAPKDYLSGAPRLDPALSRSYPTDVNGHGKTGAT